MVNITIDGVNMSVEEGTTVLQAAQGAGIDIPTLCYIKELAPEASCRMCLVEIEGNPKLQTACSFPVAEGNVIHTMSERVVEARKFVLKIGRAHV